MILSQSIIKAWIESNRCNSEFHIKSGYSNGNGYSNDDFEGYGCSSGYCDGSGYGSGYFDGSGDGDGSGSGSGDCDGVIDIKTINGMFIEIIDDVPTTITQIRGNVAKGFIVNEDLNLEKTYIVKGNGFFSHGKTLKEAVEDLNYKIFYNLNVDEKIEEFRKCFKRDIKYKGTDFFYWHNLLTGSCLQGRENFVKNKSIDLLKEYSVVEFIKITEKYFGGNIIKKLKKYYK